MAEMDLSSLMQQAQALQTKMQEMQEAAAAKTVDAQSGGGMVRVVVDGSLRVRRIEIDAAVVAANDTAMLEDLIVVAVNDGIARAQKMLADEMGKLGPLGGLKLMIVGTTMNRLPLIRLPVGVVTVTGPVTAPPGTVAVR